MVRRLRERYPDLATLAAYDPGVAERLHRANGA
jgi:hypothetical protein